MPPTGTLRSPTGARIMPSPYTNITFSAPVAAPGDVAPAAMVEFVGPLVDNWLARQFDAQARAALVTAATYDREGITAL